MYVVLKHQAGPFGDMLPFAWGVYATEEEAIEDTKLDWSPWRGHMRIAWDGSRLWYLQLAPIYPLSGQ